MMKRAMIKAMSMAASVVVVAGASGSCLLSLSGCVQFPTEKQSVADLRPQIAFKAAGGVFPGAARVWVDGLDAGSVLEAIEGQGTLRVLPGTHRIQVRDGTRVLLDEQVYLGDGTSRTLILP
jgi:hypothetical protein